MVSSKRFCMLCTVHHRNRICRDRICFQITSLMCNGVTLSKRQTTTMEQAVHAIILVGAIVLLTVGRSCVEFLNKTLREQWNGLAPLPWSVVLCSTHSCRFGSLSCEKYGSKRTFSAFVGFVSPSTGSIYPRFVQVRATPNRTKPSTHEILAFSSAIEQSLHRHTQRAPIPT